MHIAPLLAVPRSPLGTWPTPLEAPRGSGRVWVKRDDRCGFGRGGAKARKLEYLLGALERGGYDELIVVTGNVSNLVFDLLAAVGPRRLRTTIYVVDYPRADPAARRRIFAGTDPTVRLVGANPLGVLARASAAWARGRLAGRRPFVLLPGAAHPAAVVGNAVGFLEMTTQCAAAGVVPSAVFVSVATGTTLAGFALAAHALQMDGGPRIAVYGVAIDRAPLRVFALGLIRWTEQALRLPSPVPARDVRLLCPPGQTRFAAYTPEVTEACARAQEGAGLALDPIFGGKTWLAMEHALAEAPPGAGPLVYWHCGYTPEWEALGRALGPEAGA